MAGVSDIRVAGDLRPGESITSAVQQRGIAEPKILRAKGRPRPVPGPLRRRTLALGRPPRSTESLGVAAVRPGIVRAVRARAPRPDPTPAFVAYRFPMVVDCPRPGRRRRAAVNGRRSRAERGGHILRAHGRSLSVRVAVVTCEVGGFSVGEEFVYGVIVW